ncbi:hypothetical protein M0804_015636 [Polistes exclamans]|nr:hypothetical protein M0804_015636 [Polistes exclamans]
MLKHDMKHKRHVEELEDPCEKENKTTDAAGQYFANLIVGKLCKNETTKPHLLCSKTKEEIDYATISSFGNSDLRI